MEFISITQQPGLYDVTTQVFKKSIEPLYGDQSNALAKIFAGTDRQCEFLLIRDIPIGMLVYKTQLQQEYQLEDAFELKTAMIFDAFQNQGIGKYLFQRAEAVAKNYRAKNIYATVSNNMQTLRKYLQHLGWCEMHNTTSTDNAMDVVVVTKQL